MREGISPLRDRVESGEGLTSEPKKTCNASGWTAHRDENGRRFLRHEESPAAHPANRVHIEPDALDIQTT